MTQTAHLGEPQLPSVILLDVSMPRLAHYYSGLLGNHRAQAPTTAIVDSSEEESRLWTTLNRHFEVTRPASKLTILKRRKFTPETREQRIAASLAALEAPQLTILTREQWKEIVEEIEDEDED